MTRDRQWDGVVRRYPDDYTAAEQAVYRQITSRRLFCYANAGVDSRLVELKPGFEIGLGKGKWETAWEIEERARGGVSLTLRNGMRKMCVLSEADGASWSGRCLHFERAPVTVEPVTRLHGHERRVAEQIRGLLARLPRDGGDIGEGIKRVGSFLYHRVGYDSRPMEFVADHTIAGGAGECERWWFIDPTAGRPELLIYGAHGHTCALEPGSGGAWHGRWRQFEKMPVELLPGAHPASGPGPSYYGHSSRAYYE